MSHPDPAPLPRSDKEIFFEALDLDSAKERAELLSRLCADGAQRGRVGQLLTQHFREGAFMSEPAVEPISPVCTEPIGQQIGRYTLLERIGEGGFGVVYVAEQKAPVQRRVALKVIKAGMDTRQVVARFQAERQALARMDHPNIAKIFDAGTTDSGRPYFVMELVRGRPITDFCEENQCRTDERLKLFIQVCQAIEHAHQKGIIHRDLKPSNILVTLSYGHAVPRIIDFGIAKAVEGKLSEATIYTQFHQFIGTPAYMSPEQAQTSAEDVDTRTDIYSLGAALRTADGDNAVRSQETDLIWD